MTSTDSEKAARGDSILPASEPPSPEDQSVTQQGDYQDPGAARELRGIKWVIVIGSILSSTFLFSLDTTVVADVQPNIVNDLGELNKFPWLGAAFVLPAATLQLPWTKAYSLFNIKWLYIGHVLLFEIGSAIAGAAPTMDALIVGRAIAGIGGSGMYMGSISFFSALTTPKERPFYISLITPVWGLGTVLGPIVGGAFADSAATWRWGFYINLPVAAVFAPAMFFILPSLNLEPTLTNREKFKRIDWLGIAVFCGWGVSFIIALNFGGSYYAWDSANLIVLWVFTGVLLVVFVLTQVFHPFIDEKNKMYPTALLKNWKLGILQFATFAAAGVVYIPIYYIPLLFQFTRGESALTAAIRLLPFVFMIVIFSILSGSTMTKLRYYMPWYFFGAASSLVGVALLYTVKVSTSISAIYGYSILVGVGGGCFLLSSFATAPAVVAPDEVFDAVGVLSLAQGMGIVFFISIAGMIFQNIGVRNVTPLLPEELRSEVSTLLGGTSSILFEKLTAETRTEVMEAIINALNEVYTPAIAAAAITVIITPFLWNGKLA